MPIQAWDWGLNLSDGGWKEYEHFSGIAITPFLFTFFFPNFANTSNILQKFTSLIELRS
jgi:hypothetical protein